MNLKEGYNRDNFITFIKQFIPDFKMDNTPITVNDMHLKVTKEACSLGYSEALDLQIFEFKHTSTSDPRVSLTTDGFKIMKNTATNMALAAYYSENDADWRFSLMTSRPEITEKGKVKPEFSNPRRYSFYLGPEAKTHTPEEYLFKKGAVKNLNDLINRFDVEVVTKEFFAKYKGLYEEIYKFLSKDHAFLAFAGKNSINLEAFAKKALGQIVFCYFLQKKGWLGAPREAEINKGDKDFMRSLFNKCLKDNRNYYNDCLEHLFYDALNRNPLKKGEFYRDYFKCQIPFLNGGLFEPIENYDWNNSFLHIPNDLFSNKKETGVLDVFDLYNFTVYEDDPIDREVSVDPEMLGKVFENLLPENVRKGQGAYYTPREIVHYMCQESMINFLGTETGVDTERIRKLVGSKEHLISHEGDLIFTPKETEKLDNALANVKVCDPACGSGAFLVGMLHEIVSARRLFNPKEHEYKLKKEAIQNSIYGVDIDPGAVDIAKLRLWLSLVVDYELDDIEPLPNLDYKIMSGNSLLEELVIGDQSIKLFDERLLERKRDKDVLFDTAENGNFSVSAKNEMLRERLRVYGQEYKSFSQGEISIERKRELEKEIAKIQNELNPKKRTMKDYSPGLFAEKADKYFVTLRELHKTYFSEYDVARKKRIRAQIEDIEYEFIKTTIQEKVDAIDTQIRNLNMKDPGKSKKITGLEKQKLEYLGIPESLRNSKSKPYFLWKLNFFEVFQEKSGFDIIIANPPYLKERDNKEVFKTINNSGYGSKYHQGKMDYWYYFLHKAIDILKKEGVIAYITSRYWLNSTGASKLRQRIKDELSFANIVDIGKLKVFDEVAGQHMIAIYVKNKLCDKFIYKKLIDDVSSIDKELSDKYLGIDNLSNKNVFSSDSEIILHNDKFTLQEIVQLGDISDISQGVIEATDKISKKQIKNTKRTDVVVGDGIFVLNESELIKLNLNKYEYAIVRRYLDPNDITKYNINWNSKYLIYSDKTALSLIKNNYKYSNIKLHLDKYKAFITSSNKPYGLHRPRDIKYFVNPKIIFKNMFVINEFVFDCEEYFVGFSFSLIISKDLNYDLKYILAILNSRFALNWFYKYGKKRGAGVDIGVEKLRSFPIKYIPKEKQVTFTSLVDKITAIKKGDDYINNIPVQLKIKEYECEIDQMVYKLYALTEQEIEDIDKYLKLVSE